MTNTALLREKLKLKNFNLVFSILSNFFKPTLYKSTLKSAIILAMKSVCLHSKQTTGAV